MAGRRLLWVETSGPSLPSTQVPPRRLSQLCPWASGKQTILLPWPCLPLPMLGLLMPTPGHLLNRALFSAASEACGKGSPMGCFYPRMPGCQLWVQYKLLTQWTSRKASKGAWSTAGSRLCARPDHYVYAKVSHSVGKRRRSWGRPAQHCQVSSLQTRPGCLPPPSSQAS